MFVLWTILMLAFQDTYAGAPSESMESKLPPNQNAQLRAYRKTVSGRVADAVLKMQQVSTAAMDAAKYREHQKILKDLLDGFNADMESAYKEAILSQRYNMENTPIGESKLTESILFATVFAPVVTQLSKEEFVTRPERRAEFCARARESLLLDRLGVATGSDLMAEYQRIALSVIDEFCPKPQESQNIKKLNRTNKPATNS